MLHVMRGIAKSHTLGIRGNIPFLALIDRRASHNFLSKEVATKQQMNGEKGGLFWMRLGGWKEKANC